MHMAMNRNAALHYREQQTLEATILLRDLLAGADREQQALER